MGLASRDFSWHVYEAVDYMGQIGMSRCILGARTCRIEGVCGRCATMERARESPFQY